MTITYTGDVANARLCAFSRLLLRWKGSIYKLLYKEMIIFCSLYATLSIIYRLALKDSQKRIFEKVVLHCETFLNLIPLSFVLGFYVAIVVGRWWSQYMHIPWPDKVMHYITTMIDGKDDQSRIIRRSLIRYMTLGSIIVFQATSIRIKKRFPTMEHLIEAGIVSRAEASALDEVSTPHGKWWVPFIWCSNILKHARKQGRIQDNYLLKTLIDELMEYRGNLGMLFSYDWISIPLVYTQVTTLAVYTFFLGCLFGRQFLDPSQNYEGHTIDLYIPWFTILQFFFYMGWLKVAEQLINPFGEDDDDYELSWVLDRNWQISLLATDDLHGKFPPLEKDIYFGEQPPDYLPYTKSSVKGITQPHMGSTADMRISDEGMKVLTTLETIKEGVALVGQSRMPSYMGTPRRTPASTPKPIRYVNQNLMSGSVRTPDILSHASLQSCHDSEAGVGLTPAVRGSRNQQNIFHRATEKLSNWLMHHSSRMDLNPATPGGSLFAGGGLTSRQFSTSQVDDHESLQSTCGDSITDLRQDGYRTEGYGRGGNISPRLSPVAEMLCSKSAPVGVGEHFFSSRVLGGEGRHKLGRSGRIDSDDIGDGPSSPLPIPSTSVERRQQEQSLLRQCLSLQQQQQLIQQQLLQNHMKLAAVDSAEDRCFVGTPRGSRRSRERSLGRINVGGGGGAFQPVSPSILSSSIGGSGGREFKLDDCIEMNLKEFNSDCENMSSATDAAVSMIGLLDNDTAAAVTAVNTNDQVAAAAEVTMETVVPTPTSETIKEVHWSEQLEEFHGDSPVRDPLMEHVLPVTAEAADHVLEGQSRRPDTETTSYDHAESFKQNTWTPADSHTNAGFDSGDSMRGIVNGLSDSVSTNMTKLGLYDETLGYKADDATKSPWCSGATEAAWCVGGLPREDRDPWPSESLQNETPAQLWNCGIASSQPSNRPPNSSTPNSSEVPGFDGNVFNSGGQASWCNSGGTDTSHEWTASYSSPDLNQLTVTSLTPLLEDDNENDSSKNSVVL